LVRTVDDYGRYAELELAPGADAQQILTRLVNAGARLSRFELREPSLNTIFLDLVRPGMPPPEPSVGARPEARDA